MFILTLATASYAETYKWEDAEGMHFTENANSIPKKYRAQALAEARGDITTTDPEVAQEVKRSEIRAHAKNLQDAQESRSEAKARKQQDDARKLAKSECSGESPDECGPGRACVYPAFMGKKVGKGFCKSDAAAERIVAESRQQQQENRERIRDFQRDQRQREANDKLDSIDRKIRYGY